MCWGSGVCSWGWVYVLGVGESVVGGRGEGGDLATGFHEIARDLEGKIGHGILLDLDLE